MNLKDKKSLTIIVLILILAIIIIVTIFNNVKRQRYEIEQKSFLSNITNFQIKLSFYLGNMSNDTYGIYTNEEIILGKTLDNQDSDKINIIPLVDSSKKVEKDGKKAFEINYENVKEVLNIDLENIEGISFYIQDGNVVKVKFSKIPNWWITSMDIYRL